MFKNWLFMLFILPTHLFAQTCYTDNLDVPDERFTVYGDGTVLDNLTQLMWKQCSEGYTWDSSSNSCNGTPPYYTWQAALTLVDTVNNNGGFADYTDWKLPNLKEAFSLIESKCSGSSNETIFPDTVDYDYYWTSSYDASSEENAWIIDTDNGKVDVLEKDDASGIVRLVRDV